jgi:hypothetical protein
VQTRAVWQGLSLSGRNLKFRFTFAECVTQEDPNVRMSTQSSNLFDTFCKVK